eukprot:TRINITY_DN5304_c0_g1_i11.p1 TRINITY_DN5304_c0_g1~~TRINITY_DN5304_c0_g1_i11.p1  ORF type:complete len:143 (+),score=36.75 TRINITY_DN5304_c0_g1_i11:170-598(+)
MVFQQSDSEVVQAPAARPQPDGYRDVPQQPPQQVQIQVQQPQYVSPPAAPQPQGMPGGEIEMTVYQQPVVAWSGAQAGGMQPMQVMDPRILEMLQRQQSATWLNPDGTVTVQCPSCYSPVQVYDSGEEDTYACPYCHQLFVA